MKALSGGLFANEGSIVELGEWQALNEASLDAIEQSLREIFNPFPTEQRPNESQTEDDLIWPVLTLLGEWDLVCLALNAKWLHALIAA